ncbi:uncharacterized protein VTP21DRAFT_2358 [Calcarisporiella thermophila]|uniref:uncharacterized protein n=1 Tax=Calcarisporiella thermophila TaxID=911321 RepID=UPI0037430926
MRPMHTRFRLPPPLPSLCKMAGSIRRPRAIPDSSVWIHTPPNTVDAHNKMHFSWWQSFWATPGQQGWIGGWLGGAWFPVSIGVVSHVRSS